MAKLDGRGVKGGNIWRRRKGEGICRAWAKKTRKRFGGGGGGGESDHCREGVKGMQGCRFKQIRPFS